MKSKKGFWLQVLALILIFVFLVSAVFVFADFIERRQSPYSDGLDHEDGITVMGGQEYKLKDGIETMLVMGLDKFDSETVESYNNDRQADFMLLLVFDNNASTCKALHINRDTMAQMNVLGVAGEKVATVTKQIALAHTYGNGKEVSCRNVANAVSTLLGGIDIDHYVSLPMDSVADITDLVGGVEVTVLDDFTGVDDTLVKGEKVTLEGQHALNYVRIRYGLEDSSNESRMARQRQFLSAMYEKGAKLIESDKSFAEDAVLEISQYLVSDCSANRLQSYLEKMTDYSLGDIYSLEGQSVTGNAYIEFYPDEQSLLSTVTELFYELKN